MRAVILILAAWLLAACTWGEPDIDVVSAYDAGTVVKGNPAVADLVVRNLGDRPLTVAGVSTSCGCTKATLTPMIIPPGGEAGLHIVYDSDAHREDLGLVERFVFISSDDPDENEVRINFTVMVEAKPVQSLIGPEDASHGSDEKVLAAARIEGRATFTPAAVTETTGETGHISPRPIGFDGVYTLSPVIDLKQSRATVSVLAWPLLLSQNGRDHG